MSTKPYIIIYILLTFLLFSCGGNRTGVADETGDTLQLHYAKNLTVIEFQDRMEVIMRNPWDTTTTLAKYNLSVPLHNAGIFSSVHLALLHELDADEAVGGICDLEFCNQQEFIKAVKEGRVANLGNSVQPSLEQIIDLNPDALLVWP